MDMPKQDRDIFFANLGLVALSFAGSYTHVTEFVEESGQEGWFVYAIAAMPEITVYLVMRKLLAGIPSRAMLAFTLLVGASAFAFTLAGNLNSAGEGTSDKIVAAWPAYTAITSLIMSGLHGARKVAAQETATQTEIRISRKRASRPAQAPVVAEAQAPVVAEAQILDAEIVETSAPRAPKARAPRAITSTRTAVVDEAEAWLRANWDATGPLTAATKQAAQDATGASPATLKRVAASIKKGNKE